jgi:hypothetical protein
VQQFITGDRPNVKGLILAGFVALYGEFDRKWGDFDRKTAIFD